MHTFHFEVLVFYVLMQVDHQSGTSVPFGYKEYSGENPCVERLATGHIAPFAVMALISSEIFNSWVAIIGIVLWEGAPTDTHLQPPTPRDQIFPQFFKWL